MYICKICFQNILVRHLLKFHISLKNGLVWDLQNRCFTKNEKGNLTKEEQNDLKNLIKILKEECSNN